MQIVYGPISELNPAEYNPRVISEAEFEGLKESIKKFGFVDPAVVNKRGMVIISGHQRIKAAESLGHINVPVVFVDLDPIAEKALNIALNSHTIAGKFDVEILPTLMEEIRVNMPDIFSLLRMDQLEVDLGIQFKESMDESMSLPEEKTKFILQVELPNELDLRDLFDDLTSKGFMVKQL